jgi:hypothetical protein
MGDHSTKLPNTQSWKTLELPNIRRHIARSLFALWKGPQAVAGWDRDASAEEKFSHVSALEVMEVTRKLWSIMIISINDENWHLIPNA